MKKTNLFELFATITLDDSGYKRGLDEASENTSKFADKLKNGLATAAKYGTAAISTAAAGIAALTKASVDGYAEYEQLVGGVETLFKDSAGKVQEYAANAYKTAGMTANEYMQTVTSFSASLINSLATSTEAATGAVTEATIDSLNKQLDAMQDTQDKNVEAVESANEKEIELLEEAYEKELADFEKLTDERIKLIDKQYAENMKLVDEEEYRRLQAVQAEIDAINAEQAADDKAAKEKAENEKKAALQEKINAAETAEEKKKAQEEYNKYLDELRQEQIEADRKARISDLKAEKDAIKEEADAKRGELKKQRDNDVKVIQESAAVELQERKKGQAAQLKALKESQAAELKALKDSNKQKLDAMRDYIAEQKKLVTDGTVQIVNATAETYEQAADLANMAITDMSDNANKMGSDMEMLQNAYNGFAKQNYTMLDNLKLGYGGTKEEMQRLLDRAEELSGFEYDISSYADIVQAIHVIQDEMGITGTTAAEAGTTISGALSAAGAAWSNLVTGISDGNSDISQLIDNFVTTITGDGSDTNLGVFGTLIPTVEKALNGMGDLIKKLVPAALDMIPNLITNTLPNLITAAASIVTALGKGILDNIETISSYVFELVMGAVNFIIEAAPDVLRGALTIVTTLARGLAENVGELADSAVDMILELVDVLTDPETLSDLVQSAFTILGELATGLINAIPKITDKIPEIVDNLVDTFLNPENLETYLQTGIDIISALFSNIPRILESVGNSIGEIINGLVEDFTNFDWSGVGEKIVGKITDGFNAIKGAGEDLADLIGLDGSFGIDQTKAETSYSSGGGSETGGSSQSGRREPTIVQNNYFTAPYDANEQDKANQKALNEIAYGH